MEEIKIFIDPECKVEATDKIEFDVVPAGETTIKKIYVKNQVDYRLNVELSLEGENISIIKNIEQIEAYQVAEVTFEFTPKITLMNPITAKLKIKINYIIR